MLLIILGNLIILSFLGIGIRRRMSLYSPYMLSSLVWLMVFLCGLVFGNAFYALTVRAFGMWLVWFLVSSLCYLGLSGPEPPAPDRTLYRLPIDITPLLVVLNLWLLYQVWGVGSGGPTHFFFNLRLSSTDGGTFKSLGVVERFYPLIFALFLFECANTRPGNRVPRLLLWFWMILYAIGTMGKLSLLTPVLGWVVVRGVRGQLQARRLFLVVPVLFAVMVMLHLVRALQGGELVIARFLSIYTYSPIVAFSHMDLPPSAHFGAHTGRFVYALAHPLVGGPAPVEVIQPYTGVPFLTNTYTVMQPFVLDFGWLGVVVGALAYGLFFGVLFRRCGAGRQLPLLIYAGLSVIIVGQFIGEFLFTMLSGHLQYILVALLLVAEAKRVDHAG